MARPHSADLNKAAIEGRRKRWQDSIDASQIMQTLKNHADGKLQREVTPTQLKAYELLLSRLVPTLSAQELTHVDPDSAKSESELIQEAIALFKAHPELARQAGFIPAPAQPVDNAPQHGDNAAHPDTKAA